ncbi:MAG: hypothetical protein LW721_08915 [Flammeovirgaceae bacterium]|jgi:hypothetical protein|nr:hypothetical protein [Flammeovirgaceae bacterium]
MKFLLFYLCLLVSFFANSQVDTIYNVNGVEKIPYYEQLYRFRVWRDINLKEKQNAALVPEEKKKGLLSFLLRTLKSDSLKAYDPADLDFTNPVPAADVLGKQGIQGVANFDSRGTYTAGMQFVFKGRVYDVSQDVSGKHKPGEDPLWRWDSRVKKIPATVSPFDEKKNYDKNSVVSFEGRQYTALQDLKELETPFKGSSFYNQGDEAKPFYTTDDITSIQLIEDVIFDKRRSKLVYDIVGFVLYDNEFPKALVNFKEFAGLVDRLYHERKMKTRQEVTFVNRYNPSIKLSFVDAFKLRLFHGIISKVENPDDLTISRIYENNNRSYGESVFARWEEEMKMMEKEHNLWEY